MKFTILGTVTLFSHLILQSASAAIWTDTEVWTPQWEQKYSDWMRSPNVREKMFNDRTSTYYGINTDCADTAYAFRAIFAYENKLPFAIANPSGARSPSKSLNNKTTKYDYLGSNEVKKLVTLINEIGDSVGTENLTRIDTFPMSIKAIVPGAIFTYKINARFGKSIRHAYNIKDINDVGTFDVIYSTQANQKKRGDLLRRKDFEFVNLPNDPWGFRRFRWPENIGVNLSALPVELSPSNEQYEISRGMSTRAFFKYVSKQLASTDETSAQRLERLFTGVCLEANARIGYVNEAIAYQEKNGGRCMNYEDFDAFSTPARDTAIFEQFQKLAQALEESKANNDTNSANFALVNYMFNGTGNLGAELLAKCPVNYRADVTMDLREYWKRAAANKMSSHPNDSIEVRWGERTSPKTRCKVWY